MDNKIIEGAQFTLSLKVGDNFIPVFCSKSVTFELTNEIILRTGINDGLFTKRRVRKTDWSGSATGVAVTDNTIDRLSPFYLLQEGIRRSEGMWEFEFTNLDGEVKNIIGNAVIESVPINGDVGSFVQCSVNILGSGGINFEGSSVEIPEDENVDSDYWAITPGGTSITGNSVDGKSLTGKYILSIARTGASYTPITSGTASGLDAKFISGTGTIQFDTNIPFEDGEWVWAMWKDA